MSDIPETQETQKKPPCWISFFCSYFLLGVLLAYLSPHILGEEAAKRTAAVLSAPLVAEMLYPKWDLASPDLLPTLKQADVIQAEGAARPPITLTLVTDDDLKAYKTTYPLAYSFHADRLDSIAARRPAAIFIDMVFLDERQDPSIEDFVQTLCSIGLGSTSQPGIPLFLASLQYLDQPLRSELATAAQRGCFNEVAVPRLTDQLDRNNWEYPMQIASTTLGSRNRIDSPALAIYRSLAPSAAWAQKDHPTHLSLVWGMTPHAYNVARMRDSNGTPLCRSSYKAIRDLPVLGGVRNDLFGDATEQFGKPFCAFHASMPMHFLSAKPEIADRLLHGRIVMYGADLQSLGDNAYTPLHNAIAGAHVHAMALDNLLRFGPDYPRAEGFSVTRLNAGTVFPLIMILLVALLMASTSGQATGGYFRRHLPSILGRWVQWAEEAKFTPGENGESLSRRARLGKVIFRHVFGVWPIYLVWIGVRLLGALALLLIIGATGLHVFNLGVLSWLEYAFLPILLSTFKGGHQLADWLDKIYFYMHSPQT